MWGLVALVIKGGLGAFDIPMKAYFAVRHLTDLVFGVTGNDDVLSGELIRLYVMRCYIPIVERRS